MALRTFYKLLSITGQNNTLKITRSLNSSSRSLSVKHLKHHRYGGNYNTFSFDNSYMSTIALPNITKAPHIPVMEEEVKSIFNMTGSCVFLDMTFGAGGHTRMILENCSSSKVLCLDRDPLAHQYATELRDQYPGRVIPLIGKFSELPELLHDLGVYESSLDGIIMDVGVSSMQFDDPQRGFMLSKDGPLDMRMDSNRDDKQLTAAEILANIDEDSLYKVLKFYGEEKHARKIARAIVESRYLLRKLRTTKELAELVASVTNIDHRLDKLQRFSHPATKTFQALRILVNNELNELDYGLTAAQYYLRPGGTLVALTFHSLEDTIVKRHFTGVDIDKTPSSIGRGVAKHRGASSLTSYSSSEMDQIMAKKWATVTKHVVLPSEEEVTRNPRARSAKLRAAVKC